MLALNSVGRAAVEIRTGQFVRLMPRERPYDDDPRWWWEVTAADDGHIDVRYFTRVDHGRTGRRCIAVRNGVALGKILEWRDRDQPSPTS